MRKICVFIGSRASYSSIKSVMRAIQNHSEVELQLLVGASALLPRFGIITDLLKKDGFKIDAKFHMIIEGETPTTMAKSTGLGLIECATLLDNLDPDIVLVVGDRFEIMSVAIAAIYMNKTVAHTMGGEVSGTVDESVRHSVTKLSHYHFVANENAKNRVLRLGEDPSFVFNTGCPRIDLVTETLESYKNEPLSSDLLDVYKGVGKKLDLSKPFLLISQHPVTTEYGQGRFQIEETLWALNELKMNTILMWPNVDAGSEDIAKGIRTFREKYQPDWLYAFINLPSEIYIRLMAKTVCMIGNSSAAIREGAFIGVPAVNIGTRQNSRIRGKNVIDVPHNKNEIKKAIIKQLKNGRYKSDHLYGDGKAGKRIADILSKVELRVQKKIAY